ncbi:MAG: O-antigen ligase family protein [bacterium]
MLISFCLLFYVTVSVYDEQFQKYFYYGFIAVSFIISVIILVQFICGKAPKATFPNQNLAAGYIACAATFVFSLLVFNAGNLKSKMALFIFYLFAIAATHSRGGLFALLCGIAVVFFLKFKKWGSVIFIVMFLVAFISIPKKTLIKFAKIDSGDAYALKRIAVWKSAVDIIREKPISGTGPGNFEFLFYKYNFPAETSITRYGKSARFAHNEFLQIAAEGGIFTFFAFIWIAAIIFKNGLRTPSITLPALSAIIGHSLVDFNLHLPATTILTIFLAADIFYEKSDKNRKLNPGYVRIILITLLVFNLFNFFYKPFDAQKYKGIADKLIQEKPEQALKIYEKAAKFSPNDFEIRRIMGELFYTKGSRTKAIENLKMSIELNPHSPFSVMSLAKVYYDADEFNKAAFYLRKAIDIEPNYLLAKFFFAKTNEKQGKVERAVEEYKDIIKINKIFENRTFSSNYEKTLFRIDMSVVYNSLGFLYMNSGGFRNAIFNYNKSIEINPSNAEAHSNLASVYYIKKDYKSALKHANLSAHYESEEPLRLKNLILIHRKLGNKKEIAKLKKKMENLEKRRYAKEK